MLRSERARSFDAPESVVPLVVLELLEAEAAGVLGELVLFVLFMEFVLSVLFVVFALFVAFASDVVDALLRFAPDVLSSCTSPLAAWFVVTPGLTLPVRGTQGAAPVTPLAPLARALVLSAGRLPDEAVVVLLPVVVVSAPTPDAPLVAFRPVKRVSGLVDVLLGVVLAGTPAVVPASVGVPFVPVGAAVVAVPLVAAPLVGPAVVGAAVVAPLVLVVPDAPMLVDPLTPADVDEALPLTCIGGQGVPVERWPGLPPVSCCALAPAATAVLNAIAIPATRHRTIRAVNSVVLVMMPPVSRPLTSRPRSATSVPPHSSARRATYVVFGAAGGAMRVPSRTPRGDCCETGRRRGGLGRSLRWRPLAAYLSHRKTAPPSGAQDETSQTVPRARRVRAAVGVRR
jgi:hypothetical protein